MWLLHDPAPALCMAPVEATVGNMAAVNGRGSAVWDGAQWAARYAALRARWAAADEAFHAMVRSTTRAQACATGHPTSSEDGGEASQHVVSAELVLAEARARQAKCAAYQYAVDLLGDMLQAVVDARTDDHERGGQGAEARSDDGWVAAAVLHLREACRPSGSAVELL